MLGFDRKSSARPSVPVDTLIGTKVTIRGDITFSGGLHVDGTVIGAVTADTGGASMLVLSERGRIEGEVHAPHVVVNGVIEGDIHASEKVELAANARVTGNIHYRLLEMAAGAEVNGRMVRVDTTPRQLTGPEPEKANT